MRFIKNATEYSKFIVENKIKAGSIVVDATIGNGYDTLFLKNQLGEEGYLYGFDVQKIAINNTKELLINNKCYSQVKLINDSHTMFKKYIDNAVDLIVYNLGYLPSGDKSITTKKKTSIESLKQGMEILAKHGMIIMTVYPGHSEGALEYQAISDFLKQINQKKFEVMKTEFFNQVNKPPVVFLIEKKE